LIATIRQEIAAKLAIRKFKNPSIAAHSLRFGGCVAGKVDECSAAVIRGWVYDSTRPDALLNLDILVDGQKMHSATVNVHRRDIAALLDDHGVHGFECTVATLATPSPKRRVVEVRLADRPKYVVGFTQIEAVNVFGALSSPSAQISQALNDRLSHIFNHITAAHEDGLRRFDVVQTLIGELKHDHRLSSAGETQLQTTSLLYDMPNSAITGVGEFRAPISFADEVVLFRARLEQALLRVRH
jgi:hypothetical protein